MEGLRTKPRPKTALQYSVFQLLFIPNREICPLFFFKNKDKTFEIIYSIVFCRFTKKKIKIEKLSFQREKNLDFIFIQNRQTLMGRRESERWD